MPPPSDLSSWTSAIMASVVSMRPAIKAAFWRAATSDGRRYFVSLTYTFPGEKRTTTQDNEESMREFITNLALFVVFCIACSSFTACGGAAGNANLATKGNTQTKDGGKSNDYPPVASAIAEGDIYLLDGTKTKLSEHKGNVVIMNMWGIWCGPCRDEMPHLNAMYNQYSGQGLEVLGLNIGDHDGRPEPVENIKKFAVDSKIDYTLTRVEQPMVNQFYTLTKQQVVPQTFLVDREGRLRGVFVGGGQKNFDAIQQTLDKVMSE